MCMLALTTGLKRLEDELRSDQICKHSFEAPSVMERAHRFQSINVAAHLEHIDRLKRGTSSELSQSMAHGLLHVTMW
eukprot:5040182-Amphidinium_carterae.1